MSGHRLDTHASDKQSNYHFVHTQSGNDRLDTPTSCIYNTDLQHSDLTLPPQPLSNILSYFNLCVRLPGKKQASCKALKDSGCATTIISLPFVSTLPGFQQSHVKPSRNIQVTMANNVSSPVHGVVELLFLFKDIRNRTLQFRHTCLVVEGIAHDIFLGNDILNGRHRLCETNDTVYMCKDNSLLINQSIDIPSMSCHDDIFPISILHERRAITSALLVAEETIIPPNSTIPIQCKVQQIDGLLHGAYEILPIDASNSDNDYHALPCVLPINKPTVSVPVHNPTPEEIVLISNTVAASAQHVSCDSASSCAFVNIRDSDIYTADDLPHQSFSTLVTTANAATLDTDPFLSEDEIIEQRDKFENRGYCQPSMSHTISKHNAITELELKDTTHSMSDQEIVDKVDMSHFSPAEKAKAAAVILENVDVFSRHDLDLGKASLIEMDIQLKDGIQPQAQKYIPIPHAVRSQVKEILDQMEKSGVIRQCDEPSLFCSNLLVVKKKCGSKLRVILDGRIINHATVRMPTSLVTQSEVFAHLAGKSHVTTLDLSHSFFQIPLKKEAQKLTAFFSPSHGRRFCFQRSPQGLTNSQLYLRLLLDKIFAGMGDLISYADDLMIATSGSLEHHLSVVSKVLQLLLHAGIKVQPHKLNLASNDIDFLGIIWKKGQLHVPTAKIQAFLEFKTPTTPRQVKSFVCAIGYYRKFIANFSNIAHPLMEASKLHPRQFTWTPDLQCAFDQLRTALSASTTLYTPDTTLPYYVQTDASAYCGAGKCFQIDNEGRERLLCCISRTFTKTERAYGIFRKEVLSLLYCLKTMDFFLRFAEKVIAIVDAKSIVFLRLCKDSQGILLRFSLTLSYYNLEIIHKSSKENEFADILSRTHADINNLKEIDRQINPMTEKEATSLLNRLTIQPGHSFSKDEVQGLLNLDSLPSALPTKKKAVGRRSNQPALTATSNKPAMVPTRTKTLPRTTVRRPGFIPSHSDILQANNAGLAINTDITTPTTDHSLLVNNTTAPTVPEHNVVLHTKLTAIGSIPVELLISEQKKDENWRSMFTKPRSKFKVEDGALYRHHEGVWKTCLPASLIPVLVQREHHTIYGIHFSPSQVVRNIGRLYFYPINQLRTAVRSLLQDCILCQFYKSRAPSKQAFKSLPVFTKPRAAWAMDLIIGLPETPVGKYMNVLLFVDFQSLYIQLAPLQSKEASELVLNFMHYIQTPFGIPNYLRFDGEQALANSQTFIEFCAVHNIQIAPCAARSPFSNGLAERSVAMIKHMLRTFNPTSPAGKNWHEILPFLCNAHNTTVSVSGYTPEQLMFADCLPNRRELFVMEELPETPDQYARRMIPMAQRMRNDATEKRALFRNNVKKYANKARLHKTFSVGDVVLYRDLTIKQGSGNALQAAYKGPYMIISLMDDSSSAVIEHMEMGTTTKAHFTHLKKYTYNSPHLRLADRHIQC